MKSQKQAPSRANLNHRANQLNPNRGTAGTNAAYAAVHGNRGRQLNPNQARRK